MPAGHELEGEWSMKSPTARTRIPQLPLGGSIGNGGERAAQRAELAPLEAGAPGSGRGGSMREEGEGRLRRQAPENTLEAPSHLRLPDRSIPQGRGESDSAQEQRAEVTECSERAWRIRLGVGKAPPCLSPTRVDSCLPDRRTFDRGFPAPRVVVPLRTHPTLIRLTFPFLPRLQQEASSSMSLTGSPTPP